MVPMICGFEPVPQAAVQNFVVPEVTKKSTHYEQPYAMYQPGSGYNMSQGYYMIPARGAISGMNRGAAYPSGWDQQYNYNGRQQNPKFGRTKRKPRITAASPAASFWNTPVGNPGMEDPVDKDVTVVIGNLPKMLCSDKGFEVALDVAQVLPLVRLFAVEQIGDSGEAVVISKGEDAALIVMKHFQGLSCGKASGGSRGITTRYSAEAGRKLLLSKAEKQDETKSETAKQAAEELKPETETATALVENKKKDKQDTKETKFETEKQDTEEAKSETETATAIVENTEEVEPASIVVPLVLTRTNLKMRWVDFEDDCDSDYEKEEDTRSTVASTVTGLVAGAVDTDGTESSNPEDL
jgi:hypothetical protein